MELIQGIRYNFKGLAMGLRTPKLLIMGILRFVVVIVLTVVLSGIILYRHNDILALIWTMPESQWLVILWKIVSWLLSVVLASISAVIAYLLAQMVFCVFIMDYMSRVTEQMITGTVVSPPASWWSFSLYLIRQEIPRAVIPVVLSLVIMLAGLLTPAGPVIFVVSSLAACVFLAWDNTDLVPARRMMPFTDRFALLKRHFLFNLGFGLCFLIPWLNILFLSFAPVGATLYYVQTADRPDGPAIR